MDARPMGRLLRRIRGLIASQADGAPTDRELLDRFAANHDEEAFTELARRHGGLVFGVCRRLLSSEHDAEDAFQATFLVLAQKGTAIRRGEAVAAWLHQVAYRIAMKLRADNARRRGGLLGSDAQNGPGAADEPLASNDPHREAAERDTRHVIDEELAQLPMKLRAPLLLCYLEGKTVEETAKQLGWPLGTLKSRLTRGRERLRVRLTQRGLGLPAALSIAIAVPESLLAAATRLALLTVAGGAVGASPQVLALAKYASQAMAMLKWKIAAAVMAVLAAVGLGAGLLPHMLAQNGKADNPPQAKPAAVGEIEKRKPLDHFGDPLPEGAVARLGSTRFRHEGGASELVFTPDGKILLGHTNSGIVLWDVATGKELRRLPFLFRRIYGPKNNGMAVSPDGTTLAIIENKGEKILYPEIHVNFLDLASGKKLRTLALPSVEKNDLKGVNPNQLFFTADGKSLIFLGNRDGRAVVFDLTSGKVRTSLGAGDADHGIIRCAVSPDGKTLAAATWPGNALQLWDVAKGSLIQTLELATEPNEFRNRNASLAFSPNGKVLALTFSFIDGVLLFDPATGKKLGYLGLTGTKTGISFGGSPGVLAFSSDSKQLVLANHHNGALWDVPTGKHLSTWAHRATYNGALVTRPEAVSPDGKTVAFVNNGVDVRLRDIATGKERFPEREGHESEITRVVFSQDGRILASAEGALPGERIFGQEIIFWDTARNQKVGKVPDGGRAFAFSPDSKLLAIASTTKVNDGKGMRQELPTTLRLWDVAAAKEALAIAMPNGAHVLSAEFSLDGRKLITLDWKNDRENQYYVRHWDAATGKEIQEWPISYREAKKKSGPFALVKPTFPHSLSPDGRTVFGMWPGSGVSAMDIDSGKKRLLAPLAGVGFRDEPALLPSPDGRIVACWVDQPEPVAKGKGGQRPAGKEAVIQLTEVASGKEIVLLKRNQGATVKVAWSHDGRHLASAERRGPFDDPTEAQTARVWDAATGKELACFGGFKVDVNALAFAPDGQTLTAGLRDGTILIWDVSNSKAATGKLDKNDLEARWTDLAGASVPQAHQAIGTLVASPKDSVPFLSVRLQPARVVEAAKIRQWILDLDDPTLAVRQSAAIALAKADGQARAPIQKAIKENASLELRRRLEQVLDTLDVPEPNALRVIRAIMVLERIGSPEARAVLEALARGAPGARETEEAKASLQRLIHLPH